MWRWLFTASAILSHAMLIVTLFFWMRSNRTYDEFEHSWPSGSSIWIHSESGQIFFEYMWRHEEPKPGGYVNPTKLEAVPLLARKKPMWEIYEDIRQDREQSTWTEFAGLSYLRFEFGSYTRSVLVVPYWLLSLMFALVPALWLVAAYRRLRTLKRAAAGLCSRCGCTPDGPAGECSKCGTMTTVLRVAQSTGAPGRERPGWNRSALAGRWLVMLAAIISHALLVLTVCFWIRSVWTADRIEHFSGHGPEPLVVQSESGTIFIEREEEWWPGKDEEIKEAADQVTGIYSFGKQDLRIIDLNASPTIVLAETIYSSQWESYEGWRQDCDRVQWMVFAGLGYMRFENGDPNDFIRIYNVVAIPHWFLSLLLSVLPVMALLAHRRRLRALKRAAAGLCPRCGYDPRGPGTCPECGQALAMVCRVTPKNETGNRTA